ncbi:hypothetical protein BDV97DRAFT_369240 [Delphinella strobiligena]|nr:hypothetical protein BDV97DRAFT_369240 [Delphinella strobiligena]
MAQQRSPNPENGSEESSLVQSLPLEVQEMIGNQMVFRILINLSIRENIDTPAIALGLPHIYRTYFRHNWFLIPAACHEENQAILDDWIWARLNSRMIEELAHPSVGLHLVVQVAIVASDVRRIGPGEWPGYQDPRAVCIREDPESIYRLFALVRRFREKTSQAIDMRHVLVTERKKPMVHGERKNAHTKCVMPEPIGSYVSQICNYAVYNELIPLLEMTNGAPSETALTLADRYLPTNDPVPVWAAALITPDPEIVRIQEAVANDPALRIRYAIKNLRKEVAERIFFVIHTLNSSTNYETLLQASDF